jgi:hypothetical protein
VSEPTRYPLAWPPGRPRRRQHERKAGNFSTSRQDGGNSWRTKRDITITQAMDRLTTEVERLGGRYPLLSADLELRLDGAPRGGQAQPADPGVCLYFSLGGKPMAMACDAYTRVEQNIAALAAHIEATRAIARHGVATAAETLQAFEALPAPFDAVRDWRKILGDCDTITGVRDAWRAKAQEAHPDRGGHHAAMAELNAARDAALKELSA